MRIYYSPTRIENYATAEEIGLIDEPNLPFIELDETQENKPTIKLLLQEFPMQRDRWTVDNGNLFRDGILQSTTINQSRIDIKDTYETMIARLDQIQAANNPTNAQIVQAIKDEALYIERIMKVIKTIVT